MSTETSSTTTRAEVRHDQRPARDGCAAAPAAAPPLRQIGRGRSGVVFAITDSDWGDVAAKVFVPERFSSVVMGVLTGAPNPYRWCRSAVQAGVLRRRILQQLVPFWFGSRLRLPATVGCCWNDTHRGYELRAELIKGRHAALRHGGEPALDRDTDPELVPDEITELTADVMRPLQVFLERAGFDGLLWQAGRGNPVAASNFMLVVAEDGSREWVWIDLESGVPALFPLDVRALVRDYLPLSVKHGGWLFDDVDTDALCRYLADNRNWIEVCLGPDVADQLDEDAAALARHQRRWKSRGRSHRTIASWLVSGRLTRQQARHYLRRRMAWRARYTLHVLLAMGRLLAVLPPAAGKLGRALSPRRWLRSMDTLALLLLSQRYRSGWSRRHVLRRLSYWRSRKFVDRAASRAIRREARTDDAAEYIADFGVHVACKPAVEVVQWMVIPTLFATGAIEQAWLAAVLFAGLGGIVRTAYTAMRSLQALLRGRRPPWLALLIGGLPVVGLAAYPAQLLHAGGSGGRLLARFVLHDIGASLGRRIPIWGGPDGLLEHWFNRRLCRR